MAAERGYGQLTSGQRSFLSTRSRTTSKLKPSRQWNGNVYWLRGWEKLTWALVGYSRRSGGLVLERLGGRCLDGPLTKRRQVQKTEFLILACHSQENPDGCKKQKPAMWRDRRQAVTGWDSCQSNKDPPELTFPTLNHHNKSLYIQITISRLPMITRYDVLMLNHWVWSENFAPPSFFHVVFLRAAPNRPHRTKKQTETVPGLQPDRITRQPSCSPRDFLLSGRQNSKVKVFQKETRPV